MSSDTVTPRFKGQPIELGDTVYIVPPLALGAIKELLPRIQSIKFTAGVPGATDIDTIVDVALAAIQRNYPTTTKEELLDLIDLGNVKDIFRTIMGLSGLKPIEGDQGNAGAGAPSP